MKFMTVLFIALGVASVGALAAGFYFLILSFTPNPQLPTQTLKIGDASFTVEIANTTTTRTRGLSGRGPLAPGAGMLFIFDSPNRYGFWMKDMKFPLDFVWINNNNVVGVTENAPAPASSSSMFGLPLYYPPEKADKVLEVDAGSVKKYGIQAGQTATFTP